VSIDDGIPERWDADVLDACKRYRQGHLVESPPFFYAASAAHGIWALTREAGDRSVEEELFETETRPPYGLVTTETCDIVEEAAQRPRQPWISIAPVFDLSNYLNPIQKRNLERHRVGYVRLLDPPALSDGLWVADFRIEEPVEKSWLVGRLPIESYRSEQDYDKLARALAARRERPVYSDDIHKALIKPLRRWIEQMNGSRRGDLLNNVLEVRILFAGSPLDPDSASLLVITDQALMDEVQRRLWDEKWETFKRRMEGVGVPLLANAYMTLDTCSARLYLDSFQVDLSFVL
jgi:hypothetical protein